MFFFWFIIKSILAGVIGNSFYKWFQGTKTGIWFDARLRSLLDNVTHKEHKAAAKKSPQIDMFEKRK
tara:strand:+ start:542 stop:742 length:201 start_codon:yes stop_codon:yes gene_type:complete